MYAEDHEDRLPPYENWAIHLEPYVRNKAVFNCPLDFRGPGFISYEFLSSVAGQPIEELEEDQPLLIDAVDGEVAGRHRGGYNVALKTRVAWTPDGPDRPNVAISLPARIRATVFLNREPMTLVEEVDLLDLSVLARYYGEFITDEEAGRLRRDRTWKEPIQTMMELLMGDEWEVVDFNAPIQGQYIIMQASLRRETRVEFETGHWRPDRRYSYHIPKPRFSVRKFRLAPEDSSTLQAVVPRGSLISAQPKPSGRVIGDNGGTQLQLERLSLPLSAPGLPAQVPTLHFVRPLGSAFLYPITAGLINATSWRPLPYLVGLLAAIIHDEAKAMLKGMWARLKGRSGRRNADATPVGKRRKQRFERKSSDEEAQE